jgi:hypothetical protein
MHKELKDLEERIEGIYLLPGMQPRTSTTSQSAEAKTTLQENRKICRSNLTLLCLKIGVYDAKNLEKI